MPTISPTNDCRRSPSRHHSGASTRNGHRRRQRRLSPGCRKSLNFFFFFFLIPLNGKQRSKTVKSETAMQSTFATAMTHVANKTKALQVVPLRLVLRLQRSVVQVRCTKEDGQSEQPPPVTTNS